MDKLILQAQLRKETGRRVRKLRRDGFLPANIFGKKIKSQAISVKLSDFVELYKKAGETTLIYLNVAGDKTKNEERAVLISNIQHSPLTELPIHADFHQVDLKEKVTAKVPVEVIGESPAEKQAIGTVVTYINEIEVEALPTDLPEKFIVDASNLTEIDQQVKVSDLNFDKKKIDLKVDPESIVVKVEPPQKEEVVTQVAPIETVGPEGIVKPEGETPTEVEKTQSTEEKASEGKNK